MNENINIAEILKDAPKGTKLWSPIYGRCILDDINTASSEPIIVRAYGNRLTFSANGLYYKFEEAECLLFPSKENRDWSTFKAPWIHKHFEPGQKVLVPYYDRKAMHKWRLTFYSHYNESSKQHVTIDNMYFLDEEVIAYEDNEDKFGKPVYIK